MERLRFFGKNISPDQEKVIGDKMHNAWESSRAIKAENEVEKNPEDVRFIDRMNDYLREEFEELGISDYEPLSPHDIRFVSENFGNAVAAYDPDSRIMFVWKDPRIKKQDTYVAILHEMIHSASFHKYHIRKRENGSKVSVKNYRFGYESKHPDRSASSLKGLNEALTCRVQLDIFNQKHLQDINKEFDFSMKEGIKFKDKSQEILDEIISGIAEHTKEKKDEVLKRFKGGLFTGEMLHLRDIEQVFGKGSLQTLNTWEQSTLENEHEALENQERILQYFRERRK